MLGGGSDVCYTLLLKPSLVMTAITISSYIIITNNGTYI